MKLRLCGFELCFRLLVIRLSTFLAVLQLCVPAKDWDTSVPFRRVLRFPGIVAEEKTMAARKELTGMIIHPYLTREEANGRFPSLVLIAWHRHCRLSKLG